MSWATAHRLTRLASRFGQCGGRQLGLAVPAAADSPVDSPFPTLRTLCCAAQEASLLWRLRHSNIVALCGVSISPEGQGLLLMVSC